MSAGTRLSATARGTLRLRPPARPRVPPSRARSSLHRAAPALALYAAARLTGLLVLTLWARHTGRHPRTLLGASWDAVWYARIVAHGYGNVHRFDAGRTFSDEAFFPLYPALVRAVTAVVPGGFVNAALLVSGTAALAAAWGIHAVGERLYDRRTATLLVLLWGLLPHAVVQSMAYTESLMTALAAWALFAVLTGRWLWAGSLALLAGLSRPNAVAVAAAVCLAAGPALRKAACAPSVPSALRDGRTWRIWTGAALAPLGWLGYVLSVGARHGDPLGGYLEVQRLWGSEFDFGRDALLTARSVVLDREPLTHTVAMGVVLVSLVLFLLLVLDRPPLPVLVCTALLVVIALAGAGYFPSKPRFLLPAFPLLLPPAVGMARARPRTVVVTVGALAGLSCCYGAYLLTVSTAPL